MNHKITGTALAAAAAGLILAGCAIPGTDSKMASAGDIHCSGVNSCKGKTSCKSADNNCKGKNSCKGEGWLSMSKEACAEKGGTVI